MVLDTGTVHFTSMRTAFEKAPCCLESDHGIWLKDHNVSHPPHVVSLQDSSPLWLPNGVMNSPLLLELQTHSKSSSAIWKKNTSSDYRPLHLQSRKLINRGKWHVIPCDAAWCSSWVPKLTPEVNEMHDSECSSYSRPDQLMNKHYL